MIVCRKDTHEKLIDRNTRTKSSNTSFSLVRAHADQSTVGPAIGGHMSCMSKVLYPPTSLSNAVLRRET